MLLFALIRNFSWAVGAVAEGVGAKLKNFAQLCWRKLYVALRLSQNQPGTTTFHSSSSFVGVLAFGAEHGIVAQKQRFRLNRLFHVFHFIPHYGRSVRLKKSLFLKLLRRFHIPAITTSTTIKPAGTMEYRNEFQF